MLKLEYKPLFYTNVVEVSRDFVILIDAGHGWNTPGKRSNDDSLRENEFNDAVLNKICYILDKLGINYEVVSQGWEDDFLLKRIPYENDRYEQWSKINKTVLGVSIHANAADNTDANGLETFYFKKNERVSIQGSILASIIQDSMIEHVDIAGFNTNNRGSKGANFAMLRETKGIWCLVECGFMTNKTELKYLLDDCYRNVIAESIVIGLIRYMQQYA